MVGFCDSLALSLNEHTINHVVYFDLAKAFDNLSFMAFFLKKLKDVHIIDGTLLKFINSFLHDSYQKVVIGSESSIYIK